MTDIELIIEKSVITEPSLCWLWSGSKNNKGYGRAYSFDNKKNMLSHRISYEAFIGKIPKDMTVDHLCLLVSCVNPFHMELVSVSENTKRAMEIRFGKDTCIRGHDWSENKIVYRGKRTNRVCRKCKSIINRKYHLRTKLLT